MRLARGFPSGGPKTSSSSSPIGIVVASDASLDALLVAAGPENNGAGGRGRLGLPPYCEEGVPGRGLPLRSDGSYATFGGGGLDMSDEPLEGVHERTGEVRPGERGIWDGISETEGGGICGASSSTDEVREGDNDAAEGRNDRIEGLGLSRLDGELVLVNLTRIVARRAELAAVFPTCAEADHVEDADLASTWDTCASQRGPLGTGALSSPSWDMG